MNRTPDLRCMGFDGYGATRETGGTSQNVKRPRTVATAGGMAPTYTEVSTCPTIRLNPRKRQ